VTVIQTYTKHIKQVSINTNTMLTGLGSLPIVLGLAITDEWLGRIHGFAAGVMMFLSIFDILPESIAHIGMCCC